jgi:ABC-type transport system involved in multi-copper enzyme maturation permease subunit
VWRNAVVRATRLEYKSRHPETSPTRTHWINLVLLPAIAIGLHGLISGGFRDGFATAFSAVVLVALLIPTIAAHSLIAAALTSVALIVAGAIVAPNPQVIAVQLAVVACAFAPALPFARRSVEARAVVSATTTLALFAWLAAPIWTSHYGSMPQRAVDLHPLLAVNGLLAPTDAWTHRPAMYTLTNLGQDQSYAMPRSAWLCVAVHAGVATLFISIAGVGRLRRAHTPA